jgi:serine/threonine-protein kinase
MISDDDDTLRVPRVGDAPLPGAAISPGTRVGEYVVKGLLGAGAHGAVFLAEHRVLGRRAAVKVLHHEVAESREMTARFVREAQAVNRVRHPDIVDIYDIGELPDGRPYCVMELLEGRTLKALLDERAPLPPAEAVAYLAKVCQALQAAHAVGVVHRDVKAGNIMLLSEGEAPAVKLLDFGVAKLLAPGGDGLTVVGQRIGTASCMSPEQIRGESIDLRADVYALGVLLYQMLTGRRPFEAADPAEVERMHLEVAPPRPSALAAVPPALDAVVARCLEKDRERRFPSAIAVLEAAHDALAGGPLGALRAAPAVAVHVSLRPAGTAGQEALLAQADACDAAEAALRGEGFALVLATASSLLGVRLLGAEPGAALLGRAEAVTWSRGLAESLARPGIDVAVCVHASEAEVRDGAEGPEVVGGPICEPERWLPEGGPAFSVTEAARVGLRE